MRTFVTTSLCLLTALLLTAFTVIAPVKLSLPPVLPLTITGTALVSYFLGPRSGLLYAFCVQCIMTAVAAKAPIFPKLFILAPKLLEGFAPGALNLFFRRRTGEFEKGRRAQLFFAVPLAGALALAILAPCISWLMFWLTTPAVAVEPFSGWFFRQARAYVQHQLPGTLLAFCISCYAAYCFARFFSYLSHQKAPS